MGAALTSRKVLLGVLAVALMAAACGRVGASPEHVTVSGRPVRVVTTVGMITDVVENIGGSRVEVTGLMGPGIDPHLFRASERDVVTLAEADLVLYGGLHLEAQMAEVFEKMRSGVLTVAVTRDIPRNRLLSPPGFQGSYDPHVWFDVRLWMIATRTMRDALIEVDPEDRRYYEARTRAYLQELAELHRYVAGQARRVPARQRVLITAHDAFNYFGRAYGFDVRGLQGISTAAEIGARDVSELADLIVRRRVPAVFVETSVSPRFVQALQQAVAARGAHVDIGGSLYSDALGDPGTPAGTYTGMVRHNIDTIVAGLLGEER